MVIQHNIPAINSHRNLAVNNRNTNKNLEKLSSGFRINRAGDDAAGLAISEKMRGQIRGLAKAEENTSNAINLIQTAEGGMQELHSIAQRMRELSVQATNGTYHDDVDREALDLEFQELKEEFNRITDYTNYNGIKLLNGDPYADGGAATGGAFRAAVGGLADVVTGGGGKGSVAANGVALSTAMTNEAVILKYTADGELDLAATNTANANFNITTGKKGELILESTTAAKGIVTLTGDWTKANASFMTEAKIEVSTDTTAGTATVKLSATAADQKFKKVEEDFKTGGFLVSDVKTWLGTAGTIPANTEVNFELIYNKQGEIDLEAMNKAVAGNTGAGEVSRFSIDSTTGNLTAYINGVTGGGTGMIVLAGDFREVKDGVGKVEVSITTPAAANPGANLANAADITFTITSKASNSDGAELIFQVGANGTKDQQVYMTVYNMAADQLGTNAKYEDLRDEITQFLMADANGKIKDADGNTTGTAVARADFENLTVEDLNILSTDNANVSIQTLTKALDDLSMRRAELGAKQNRLEYTLNNLGVTKENLTAAESTIRDVDMAKEMMEFTKNSILVQANQAMLAQANTLPQGILQLLR